MEEIKARNGGYLTQAALEDESQRIFVTALSGYRLNADDWKDATQADKDAWEAEYLIEP